MFTRIEAKNYRCLKEVNQALNPFEILVGPNGSGKSTFLDVIGFLGDFVGDNLFNAAQRRTTNFHDLVWGRKNNSFQLTVEAKIPPPELDFTRTRSEASGVFYTMWCQLDADSGKLEILSEVVDLLFADGRVRRPVVVRSGAHVDYHKESGDARITRQRIGNRSSLQVLPDDSEFPAAAWLRELLEDEIRTINLEGRELSRPSPQTRRENGPLTGSDLPWWIDRLASEAPQRFKNWIAHVRTSLPEVRDIDSVLQQSENQRYVRVHYGDNVQVPSWMLSEGTLRLLALTILAYLPAFDGVYLIEEPENGVHPSALETIYESLSSIYNAQVLVSSHSPILLNMARPEQLLCFSKSEDGAKIVRGSEHPALRGWQNEVSLGTLAASGLLG